MQTNTDELTLADDELTLAEVGEAAAHCAAWPAHSPPSSERGEQENKRPAPSSPPLRGRRTSGGRPTSSETRSEQPASS
jgi:hypothetical protein